MKITTTIVVVAAILVVLFNLPKDDSPDLVRSNPGLPTATPTIAVHPLSLENFRRSAGNPQALVSSRRIDNQTEIVEYKSDGNQLYALKITPNTKIPDSGWPVIIVNHGYIPPDQYSTVRSYINTSRFFASKGFLVLKPDYRGHDQSQGKGQNRLLSRSEYTLDVLNLIKALNNTPNIKVGKIFMYGHSMGGDITLQILEVTDQITAATLWAPAVTTLLEQSQHFLNKTKPDSQEQSLFTTQYQDFVKNYHPSQISAFENLNYINSPLIIHHGTKDESVPYAWGVALNDKLKSLGKSTTLYSYPNDNHDIAGNFSRALNRDVEFFNSFLD